MGNTGAELLQSLKCVCGVHATISVDRDQKTGPRYQAFCDNCWLICVVGDFPETIAERWQMAISEIFDNMDEAYHDGYCEMIPEGDLPEGTESE